MNHLFNLLLIALLLGNLLGLTLWVRGLSQLPPGLAKVVAVVAGCMVFFFVEHFVGLGALGWLLPVMTVGAAWGIWKNRGLLEGGRGAAIAFLAGFGYALLWRYTYPNIDPSSEKLADLNFVASYLPGHRLPAPDLWLTPYALTQYYSFQHYAAALLGRVMSLPAGTAYNVAYCVITGLVMAPAYDFVRTFTRSRWRQILILAALLLGGTGASVLTPFMMKNEQTVSCMRFIGAAACLAADDADLTPWGQSVQKALYGPGPMDAARRETVLDLPMETFSYVVELGDYHPPLGTYVLLASALAAFGVLLGAPGKNGAPQLPAAVPRRWATGALLATVPLCIVTNTWCFPLQALLVLAGLAFLWRYRERPRWEELVGVGLIPWVLLYPCLAYQLPRTIPYQLRLVGWKQHTPLFPYLLQFWPILGITALAWFAAGKGRREYRWFVLLVAAFLVLVEMLNVDDIYVGHFERFNTAFKWWPWVAALSLLLLAPLSLADLARSRTARIGTIVILAVLLSYTAELGREFYLRPKTAVGRLDGADWLRVAGQDPAAPRNLTPAASILNYLTAHRGGVILESPASGPMAFIPVGAVPLFTGHPAVFGWPAHEQLWRGYQRDIEQRWNRANEFFRGDLPGALDFLGVHDVRFILWPGTQAVTPELFAKVKAQIEPRYTFVRFDESQPLCGIWERK